MFGIVALDGAALARYRTGQIAVGVETDADRAMVTLTVARPLPAPGAPR